MAILTGIPVIPVVAIAYIILGPVSYLENIALWTYGLLFAWAILDNDYSNLRRIGMDEYRRKLKT